MGIEFKKIENAYDKYYSYLRAMEWDTTKPYNFADNVGVEWLILKMIGVYNQENLVALGCIRDYYDLDKKKKCANITTFVDYRYIEESIKTKLLSELLSYCKELEVEEISQKKEETKKKKPASKRLIKFRKKKV